MRYLLVLYTINATGIGLIAGKWMYKGEFNHITIFSLLATVALFVKLWNWKEGSDA